MNNALATPRIPDRAEIHNFDINMFKFSCLDLKYHRKKVKCDFIKTPSNNSIRKQRIYNLNSKVLKFDIGIRHLAANFRSDTKSRLLTSIAAPWYAASLLATGTLAMMRVRLGCSFSVDRHLSSTLDITLTCCQPVRMWEAAFLAASSSQAARARDHLPQRGYSWSNYLRLPAASEWYNWVSLLTLFSISTGVASGIGCPTVDRV